MYIYSDSVIDFLEFGIKLSVLTMTLNGLNSQTSQLTQATLLSFHFLTFNRAPSNFS